MKRVAFAALAVAAAFHPSFASADGEASNHSTVLLQGNKKGVPAFCHEIYNTWWPERQKFKKEWPYADSEARRFCAKWNGDVDGCYKSGQDYDHAMVMCEIEGHGLSQKCVPVNCAHLNAGQCNYESTGGLCQWFTKSPYGKGCMENPCHMGGRAYNNRDYCENDPDFLKKLEKYHPKVECAWCGMNKMGCQNVDPKPKGGCNRIGAGYVNKVAKEAAKKNLPVGQILQMHKHDKGYAATGCGDKNLVVNHDFSPVECIEGQVGCKRELGFKPKYKEGKKNLKVSSKKVDLDDPKQTLTTPLYFNNLTDDKASN